MPLDPTKTSKTLDVAKTVKLTGDAVVGDVKAGKKFYKDDPETQLTGTMPTEAIVAVNDDYEAGYHAGNPGGLDAIDTDLAPANIKAGETIFGKLGTFSQSLAEDVEGDAYDTAYTTTLEDEGASKSKVASVSKVLTFDATSLAFCVGFINAVVPSGTIRLYMGGVEMQSVGTRHASYVRNYVLRDFKALSGSQTCTIDSSASIEFFGQEDHGECAAGIGVGSVKLV